MPVSGRGAVYNYLYTDPEKIYLQMHRNEHVVKDINNIYYTKCMSLFL